MQKTQISFLQMLNRVSLLSLSICAALNTPQALANDEAETAKNGDESAETIEIVTARRYREALKDVPVAVTTFSEDKLDRMGAQTVVDIERSVPNLTVNASRATNSTLTAYLRGVGQNDPLWGYEPGVGLYIDDVYFARPQAGVLDILDIERIEVLRGPQGTLYGKNTMGGAIKYITRELPDSARGYVDVALGSYNQRDIKLGYSAPLSGDLMAGVSVAKLSRDGFGEVVADSPFAGDAVSDKDIQAARLNVTWNIADNLKLKLVADDIQDDSNARGGQRLSDNCIGTSCTVVFTPLDDRYDTRSNLDPSRNEVSSSGQALTLTWDIDKNWQFKSVTAKREGDTTSDIDFDQLNRPSFDVLAVYEDEQLSQEFQLNYDGDALHSVMGLYFFDGDACGEFDNVLGLLGLTQETSGCVNTKSQSIFAQASYRVADRWSLTAGGRYDRDKKDATVRFKRFLGLNDQGTLLFDGGFDGDKTFNEFSPRIGVEFTVDNNTMMYASMAHGFKSGGFNMRGNILADTEAGNPFKPETVDTTELGIKGVWFDNRLTGYFAIFDQDYQDKQVTVSNVIIVGTTPTTVQRVLNAADASGKGYEAEMSFKATSNLTFNLVYGVLDAEYEKFVAALDVNGNPTDISETAQMINSPEKQYSFSASYNVETAVGNVLFTAEKSYRDDVYVFEAATAVDQEAYSLLNASVIFYPNNSQWRFALQGRNLKDEAYRTGGYNFPGNVFDNTVTGFYGDPKTYTVSANYSF